MNNNQHIALFMPRNVRVSVCVFVCLSLCLSVAKTLTFAIPLEIQTSQLACLLS